MPATVHQNSLSIPCGQGTHSQAHGMGLWVGSRCGWGPVRQAGRADHRTGATPCSWSHARTPHRCELPAAALAMRPWAFEGPSPAPLPSLQPRTQRARSREEVFHTAAPLPATPGCGGRSKAAGTSRPRACRCSQPPCSPPSGCCRERRSRAKDPLLAARGPSDAAAVHGAAVRTRRGGRTARAARGGAAHSGRDSPRGPAVPSCTRWHPLGSGSPGAGTRDGRSSPRPAPAR